MYVHRKFGLWALLTELKSGESDEDSIKHILRMKAVKVDAALCNTAPPLHVAVRSTKLMRLLLAETLEQGVKVDVDVAHGGNTPLRAALAAASGEGAAIALIDAGASMAKACGEQGDTVLHAAAYNGWKDLARRALDAGLDPKAKWERLNAVQWAETGKRDLRYNYNGLKNNHDEIIAMMREPKQEAGQRRERE